MAQDGCIVTAEENNIGVVETSGTRGSDVYKDMIHFLNAEISKAILSQTLTTEQGDTGSYAMSQTHLQVRDDVVMADARLIEQAMNDLIKWTLQLNGLYNPDTVPIFRMYKPTEIELDRAERDAKLAATGQILFSQKYVEREYGFKPGDIKVVAPQPQGFSEFANQHQGFEVGADAMTEIGEMATPGMTKAIQKMIAPLMKKIDGADTIEEVKSILFKEYGEMDDSELERMFFLLRTIGHSGGLIAASIEPSGVSK